MVKESIEESSTSAMVDPVMEIAVSSFPETSFALALQVGTSLTAETVIDIVAVLDQAAPSYTWKVNESAPLKFASPV